MVSGGADSTFMLHALHAVHNGPITVVTFDHGLRPEAAEECTQVCDAARRLGRPAVTRRLQVEPGPGVQARARDARYRAARDIARDIGAALAVGHTCDDQAETVLMRLARGAGTRGASAMSPRAGDLARPLLAISRAETRDWCHRHGISVADDPSNQDPRYARIRARDLVARLEEVSPGARVHLAQFADILADEHRVFESVVDDAERRCRATVGWRVEALLREPVAVQRELLVRLIRPATPHADAAAFEVVEAIRRELPDLRPRDLAGGVRVRVVEGELRVDAPVTGGASFAAVCLESGGRVHVGSHVLSAWHGPAPDPSPRRVGLPVGVPLLVRGCAPGDRVALDGGGHALVHRMLAGARVPSERRPEIPVVVAGAQLVWVAGHRFVRSALVPEGEPAVVCELEDA